MYKISLTLLVFWIFSIYALKAQTTLPVLKTNSKNLDVREGHNFYKNYWQVSPEVKKDIYYTHRFKSVNQITFYSDVDSLSFKVTPEQTYDFIVLLSGKDSCLTEISTIRTSYFKDGAGCIISTDTIPFDVGSDDRIYINGQVNGSEQLKFFFDDGADNTILFPSAFNKKTKLNFTGSIENNGTGGTETRQTSDYNSVQLSKLKWKNAFVMYVDKQIGEGDGTIGFDLFEDKIIEINFDKKILIIHDSALNIEKGYTRIEMNLNGGQVPSIPAILLNKGKKYEADFLFDMGATGCLFLNQGFLAKNNLYGTMKELDSAKSTGAGSGIIKTTRAILPALQLGNHTFQQVPVNLENQLEHDPGTGTLGMNLLKRFNIILDYQNNLIYLKPNQFVNQHFKGLPKNKKQ